jgi:hypothetical protein
MLIISHFLNLRLWSEKKSTRRSRDVNALLRSFIHLQLLNREFNRCFSNWILPSFLVFQIPATIVSFVLVFGFHEQLYWIYLLLFVALEVITVFGLAFGFPFAGILFSGSAQLKHTLLYSAETEKWTGKVLRAFPPLKISVGNIAVIKRNTGLMTLAFILYSTLRITIMTRVDF